MVIPDDIRREARQERTQLAVRAGFLEPCLQPLGSDACSGGKRVPTHNPRLAVFAREEADVVLHLRVGDVRHDPCYVRVELERGKDVANAHDCLLWNGHNWAGGEHIDAPGGWEYE